MADILTTTFTILANQYLGGIELAAMLALVVVGLLAYINRCSLPTYVFIFFLLLGSLASQFGGIFWGIFGGAGVIGVAFFYFGLKNQNAQM